MGIILMFNVQGFVQQGMFMGIATAISSWMVISHMPDWFKRLIANNLIICDIISSVMVFFAIAVIGNGPTIFMAVTTHSILTSLYMLGYKERYGN